MKTLLSVGLGLASSIVAAAPAISFSDYLYAIGDGRDITVGYGFWVNTTVEVGALGVFDHLGDGLAESHAVSLWDTSLGTLVASTTVAAGTGTFREGFYRYNAIAPATLQPNHFYVVGAFHRANGPDLFTFGYTLADYSNFQTAPEVSFYRGLYHYGDFGVPDTQTWAFYSGGNAYLGPVPEPASIAVIGVGLLALSRRRRSRRT